MSLIKNNVTNFAGEKLMNKASILPNLYVASKTDKCGPNPSCMLEDATSSVIDSRDNCIASNQCASEGADINVQKTLVLHHGSLISFISVFIWYLLTQRKV